MKKILYSLSTLALLTFLTGCSKEADNPVGLETEGDLLALIEPDTQTKTNYDSIEGKFVWTEGDQLALHYNDGSYKEVAVNASTGSVDAPSPSGRDFYAVYPASVADPANFGSPTLIITLPDSYDISDVVSGGKSADFSPCPMVASNASSTSKLNFYHVGGLLRVTLKDLPALTQKIRVTFDKDVTGSYEVSNPGTTNPTINTRGESANNVVTFTLAADAIGTYAGEIVLNIPVPCGKYSSIYFEALNTSGATIADKTYNTRPLTFVRHHGKKMSFGEGLEPFVELELNFYEKTAWAGENNLLIAVPYSAGIPITGGTYTVTEEVLQGEETALELLPLQQGEAHGSIVLFSSPQKWGVSKKITVTFEKGEVRLSASAIYHVNNIQSIELSNNRRQYAWPGHSRPLGATVYYTKYGDIDGLILKKPLQVQWSSDKTDLAIPQKSSTASGEYNNLYAKPNDNPVITPELSIATITASLPSGEWGMNNAFSKTTTFRVVPFTAVPGGFNQYGDTDHEIIYARGNLLVENTFDGTKNNRVWKFEENQWDFHVGFDGDDSYSVQGKTKYISHFGHGTSGIAPSYEPHVIHISDGMDYQENYSDWGLHFDEYGVGSESLTTGAWYAPQTASFMHSGYSSGINGNRLAARIYDPNTNSLIVGAVFLPNGWKTPQGCIAYKEGYRPIFTYSLVDDGSYDGYWGDMEEAGAVFLPYSGCRIGTEFKYVGERGSYRLGGIHMGQDARIQYENPYYTLAYNGTSLAYQGFAVRLAHD